jgi:hypothetical protein
MPEPNSLLQKFVNYGRKKFYNIGPRLERFARDKRFSLFEPFISDEEEKSFIPPPPGASSSRRPWSRTSPVGTLKSRRISTKLWIKSI